MLLREESLSCSISKACFCSFGKSFWQHLWRFSVQPFSETIQKLAIKGARKKLSVFGSNSMIFFNSTVSCRAVAAGSQVVFPPGSWCTESKKSSTGQNWCIKLAFDYMPVSHLGSVLSFSGLPLLADTLSGHLRFRASAAFFPGRLGHPHEPFGQVAFKELKEVSSANRNDPSGQIAIYYSGWRFLANSKGHPFISFHRTIHTSACESKCKWVKMNFLGSQQHPGGKFAKP